MREKVGKSPFTVFFQWFVAPEGRKVGSLKQRVRSQLARGEMKNCTPLWREAHFQVKMWKTLGVRTTFGTWDVEKVHAIVARSTFPSQNVKNTRGADHFWMRREPGRTCGQPFALPRHLLDEVIESSMEKAELLIASRANQSQCTHGFNGYLWLCLQFNLQLLYGASSLVQPRGSFLQAGTPEWHDTAKCGCIFRRSGFGSVFAASLLRCHCFKFTWRSA